jgi:hypothetical protein
MTKPSRTASVSLPRKIAPTGASRVRWWTFRIALFVGALLAVDQLALRVLGNNGSLRGTPLAPYATATLQPSLAAELERVRGPRRRAKLHLAFDAELGWEPRANHVSPAAAYERFRARESGHERADAVPPGKRRILVFGCSFTNGTEIDDHETWAVQMETERPELEVFSIPRHR